MGGKGSGRRKTNPEPTVPVRIPQSLAEELYARAEDDGKPMAWYIADLIRQALLFVVPMPPNEGPPLPRGMGIKWRNRAKSEDGK